MSKIRFIWSSVALGATLFSSAAMAAEVGVRTIEVPSAMRGQNLAVTIWYPASGGGSPELFGDDRIFKGTKAAKDASLGNGRFPLVILSHGSGGRAEAINWLATDLAKAGFIVAGPDHPGTTSGDSLPDETPKLWKRTDDLSTVISYLTTSEDWKSHIDAEHIGVVGFSLGGAASLKLAGARTNLEAYAKYCDTYTKWDCAWYAGGRGYAKMEPVSVPKLDLRAVDKTAFEQSNLDERVKTAVLVDPGMAQAYDEDSLKNIKIPLSFINLGNEGEVPLSVKADEVAALVPDSSYVTVRGADHFSFLPECKEDARAFLKSVGEIDPICEETGRARKDIHAELSNLISTSLQITLKR